MSSTPTRTHCVVGRMLVALTVVILVACGGDDGGTGTPTAPPSQESPTEVEAQIIIANFSFGDGLTVASGTAVSVRNDDNVPHTFTAVDGSFDSGSLGTGATFSHTFDTPGTYEFVCGIHPSMSGAVTVTG